MKKALSYLLICSPLWLAPILCVPAVVLSTLKGYGLNKVSDSLFLFIKYLYFIDVSDYAGYIERAFFGSIAGKGLRIGWWGVNLLLIAAGVWRLKHPNKTIFNPVAFWSGFAGAVISSIVVTVWAAVGRM